jgi:long-chain acyl-CoA synthetase
VKAIHLSTELFTVENGLVTPSLKSKRPAVRKRYEAIIKDMYRSYVEQKYFEKK